MQRRSKCFEGICYRPAAATHRPSRRADAIRLSHGHAFAPANASERRSAPRCSSRPPVVARTGLPHAPCARRCRQAGRSAAAAAASMRPDPAHRRRRCGSEPRHCRLVHRRRSDNRWWGWRRGARLGGYNRRGGAVSATGSRGAGSAAAGPSVPGPPTLGARAASVVSAAASVSPGAPEPGTISTTAESLFRCRVGDAPAAASPRAIRTSPAGIDHRQRLTVGNGGAGDENGA
jgi:hypothetical protein